MKALQVPIRAIGNSRGIVIPKPLLAQLGMEAVVDLTVERDTIVLRKPAAPVRSGWAEAARQVAERGEDALAIGDFPNAGDDAFAW